MQRQFGVKIESANQTAKKALRIMSNESKNAHSNPLFIRHEIIKLPNNIKMENCLFIRNMVEKPCQIMQYHHGIIEN